MSYYKPDGYDGERYDLYGERYDLYGATPVDASMMPDGSGLLEADTFLCARLGDGWDCNLFVADYTYGAYEEKGW